MRKDLLNFIICKRCRSWPLRLIVDAEDTIEIISGELVCNKCGMIYPIVEGVLNTIKDETITELVTAKENEDPHTPLNDQWLLSLPCPKSHPIDTTFEYKGGDKALNFFDMLSRMELTGSETILELGAGNCWATNIFAQKGCRCIAVDVRMRRYYGLRSGRIFIDHTGKYFERVLSNLDTPPFVDCAFDLVFAQSSLQYAENLDNCLTEIHRILKLGGRLILSYSGVYGLFKKREPGTPGYYFPKLASALRTAGFKSNLIFPAYLEKYLKEGIPKNKPFHRVGKIFSVLWNQSTSFQHICKKWGTYPMILLFGVPVNLIAIKK